MYDFCVEELQKAVTEEDERKATEEPACHIAYYNGEVTPINE